MAPVERLIPSQENTESTLLRLDGILPPQPIHDSTKLYGEQAVARQKRTNKEWCDAF
jgi:hypothetical protein